MSGGVDSTLTVRLLQESGYEVYGATMNQFEGQDVSDAVEMAKFLGIPHKVLDVKELYNNVVLSYFIDSYKNGITPNPCMICDFKIKFGLFYDAMRNYFDAPYFATGHYARIVYDRERQKYQVEKRRRHRQGSILYDVPSQSRTVGTYFISFRSYFQKRYPSYIERERTSYIQ